MYYVESINKHELNSLFYVSFLFSYVLLFLIYPWTLVYEDQIKGLNYEIYKIKK